MPELLDWGKAVLKDFRVWTGSEGLWVVAIDTEGFFVVKAEAVIDFVVVVPADMEGFLVIEV